MSNGYMHFGDGIILLAALMTPFSCAIPAAIIGSALADLLSGFAMYVPATVLIKGLMAAVMGLFSYKTGFMKQEKRPGTRSILLAAAGAAAAGIVNVGGYFAAELVMYGMAGAIVDIIPNIMQSLCSIAMLFILIPAAKKVKI